MVFFSFSQSETFSSGKKRWHFDILLFLIFTYAWFLFGSFTLTWNAFTCCRLYYAEVAHDNNSHSMATILTHLVAFSRFLVMTSLSKKKNPTRICRNTLSNLWPNMVVFSYDFCSIDSEFSYREQNYIFIRVFILKTFPVTSNSQQKKMSKSALFLLLDFTDDRTNTGKSNLGAVSLIRQ